ncbi:hypothetical protein Leryth_003791 [Lithospermum erythrorhizon]|nr:hypothetical protein Leryth_003791 [Lithospermum erythrorhizon]
MIRTRLLWFTMGFASASGLMAQFIFKDLLIHRNSISNQVAEQFNALETRVANLEQLDNNNSQP